MHIYTGLNSREVDENRQKYGTNNLTPPRRESWVILLLRKFKDPIIKLLLLATLLSMVTGYFHGSMVESLGIILAVFLATVLSFLNEYKAGKEFDILNKVGDVAPVKVFRNGVACEVAKSELVVGDYVVIAQGDEVPADGHIVQSMDLAVNESSLNGESKDSPKTHIDAESYTGAYSPNMVYRGTTVTQGDGVFVVSAVGDNTEIGRTARQAAEITGGTTPLDSQLARLSRLIGIVGLSVAVATFSILVARDVILGVITFDATWNNFYILLKFFMIAVTLIVVAVPEGLAMSVTLSLAYSMRKMTAENTLVRKMHACETMGAATVICTDKTGTLTQNRMSVHYCSAILDNLFAESVALNSTAYIERAGEGFSVVGNPTEGALLRFLYEHDFSYKEYRENGNIAKRLPFNTERKFMATLTTGGSLYVKGAPEIILSMCRGVSGGSVENPEGNLHGCVDVDGELEKIKVYQSKGMRCLAFAFEPGIIFTENDNIEDIVDSRKLEYLGFAAIADPIRDDVPAAMRRCIEAGIKVKIVTGDTSLTAIEIARQAGLWGEEDGEENFITGAEFQALDDACAKDAAAKIKVMARARPADKMRLVKLLQEMGEVVAVTGDGTNDAPALNYADVGLAMGSGTSVAKQASDIILLDDSFKSVVNAVKWGRGIYLNIRKFLQFQLTINVVALLTALIGPVIGIEFPLTVTQMLWVNLIMDTFAALALATEPALDTLMKERPRRVTDFILSKGMIKSIFMQGLFFVIVLIAVLCIMKKSGGISDYELSLFFTVFVMLQFWNMFNARTLGGNLSSFHKLAANKPFIMIAAAIFVLQILIVQFGGGFFRTLPLQFGHWAAIVSGTSLVLMIGELVRYLKRKGVAKKS